MKPEVSIIMPVYNSEATVESAIAGILNQSFTDFEFIIIDDGSTDRTAEIIGRFKDPRIRFLKNETNIGLTRSLNKAISVSSGRYIARQDADDLSLPDRLEKQIAFLRNHPEIALLGTSKSVLDGSGKVTGTNPLPERPDYKRLLKSNCFAHGSVMVRREILEELGKYNETFRMSQDYELWLRMAKKYQLANLSEPLYGVRRHGGRTTSTKMTQAGLFRLLAVNLSRGEVPQTVMEQIRRDGIDIYYQHLPVRDLLKYHKAAAAKCIKYKCFKESEPHLRKVLEIKPYSLKARINLLRVRRGSRTAV